MDRTLVRITDTVPVAAAFASALLAIDRALEAHRVTITFEAQLPAGLGFSPFLDLLEAAPGVLELHVRRL